MNPIIPWIIASNNNVVPQLTEPARVTRWISITPAMQPQQAPVNATDVFNGYLNQFQWNPDVTNTLQTAFNWLNQFTDTAKGVNDLYDYMVSKTSPAFNDFQRINQQLWAENAWLLQNQLNQAYQWFWPQWEQTQRVNQYYSDLANNIAAQNAAKLWEMDAQAKASGASAWAVRNASAKLLTNSNTDLLNANAKQFEMYDNIYKNLGTYIDNYTKSMANNKNQYVRDVYDRLLQYSQWVEQARANAFQNLKALQLEDALRKWTSTAWTATPTITPEQLAVAKAQQDQANARALLVNWIVNAPMTRAVQNQPTTYSTPK